MQEPLVSVIMGTYNGRRYVLPAIASILDQTLRDFELLILDDGSTDDTGDVIAAFLRERNDPRVRVLARHEPNQGVARTMNELFAAARGDYIVPMDHDDIALPRRLEQATAYLAAHPELDGCGAGHIRLRSTFSNALRSRLSAVRSRPHYPEEVAAMTLFGGMLFNPTTCLRRRVLDMTPDWHDPALPTGSDDDWFERLCAAGARFAILPRPAILYRRLSSSASHTYADSGRATRARIGCRAARRLLPDATNEELALHARVVLRDTGITPDDLPAVRAWFERLLAAAPENTALGRVLARNWQRACALAACHDVRAAMRAYRGFAALAPYLGGIRGLWPLFYQYQKRKLHQLYRK